MMLRVEHLVRDAPSFSNRPEISSLRSIETVPTSIGRPRRSNLLDLALRDSFSILAAAG